MASSIKKRGAIYSLMGRPAGGVLSSFHPAIREQLKTWRIEREEWGPKTLLAELQVCKRFKGMQLPSRSSIARFLKEKDFIKKPYIKRATDTDVNKLSKVIRPHQRWQLDAKGNEQIKGVGTICLVNIKDVYTCFYTGTFPPYKPSIQGNPSGNDYRLALRISFCRHGLPEQIQVDHASVFFDNQNQSPFPTLFHLWLVGLGIELTFSRFRKPTDQGKVERQHRTTLSQILRKTSFSNWKRLYEECELRRQRLNRDIPCASLGEKTPFEVFPNNSHSKRCYRPELEEQYFDMNLVYKFLAQKVWTRKISLNGAVKIAKKSYLVSKKNIGQKVNIKFDVETKEFLFSDMEGLLLVRRTARGLNKQRIMGATPITLPIGFQLQFPFSANKEMQLRLYETPMVTSF